MAKHLAKKRKKANSSARFGIIQSCFKIVAVTLTTSAFIFYLVSMPESSSFFTSEASSEAFYINPEASGVNNMTQALLMEDEEPVDLLTEEIIEDEEPVDPVMEENNENNKNNENKGNPVNN